MPVHNESEENKSERRSFLGIIAGLIAAGIGTVMSATIGRFAIAPALSTGGVERWADVGPLADIPDGAPVKRNVIVSQNAGWGEFNTQKLVWVVKSGEKITVFTAVCPHLGCSVPARPVSYVRARLYTQHNAPGQT